MRTFINSFCSSNGLRVNPNSTRSWYKTEIPLPVKAPYPNLHSPIAYHKHKELVGTINDFFTFLYTGVGDYDPESEVMNTYRSGPMLPTDCRPNKDGELVFSFIPVSEFIPTPDYALPKGGIVCIDTSDMDLHYRDRRPLVVDVDSLDVTKAYHEYLLNNPNKLYFSDYLVQSGICKHVKAVTLFQGGNELDINLHE